MKTALLFILLSQAMGGSIEAGKPEVRVEVVEDEFNRPRKIIRYFLDETGKRVLIGENIEYDWNLRMRRVLTYEPGVGARLEGGVFGSGRHFPSFKKETWLKMSFAERRKAMETWPVPLPPTTPFEEKWTERQAYLEAFKDGYRTALAGSFPDYTDQKSDAPKHAGFTDGQTTAAGNHPQIRDGLPPRVPE